MPNESFQLLNYSLQTRNGLNIEIRKRKFVLGNLLSLSRHSVDYCATNSRSWKNFSMSLQKLKNKNKWNIFL